MRPVPGLALAAAALGLSACIGAAPLALPDDHPASPKAASGPVDTPTALADYKTADEFAAVDAKAAAAGQGGTQHGGMDDGAMPGMQHGGAPAGGAAPR
jgi:uncharacterized protein involved in copper resistance